MDFKNAQKIQQKRNKSENQITHEEIKEAISIFLQSGKEIEVITSPPLSFLGSAKPSGRNTLSAQFI